MRPEYTRCPFCGSQYRVPDYTSLHQQWLAVAHEWGVDTSYSHSFYEENKRTQQSIFRKSDDSLMNRSEAAIQYLHVQWLNDLYLCVLSDCYGWFVKQYPDIPSWIGKEYQKYAHEFDGEVQRVICRRYPIHSNPGQAAV